jgi:prepilin-type N-terminal cleavage/methylation domain-containing protein
MKRTVRGFTLIEIMVVIMIIGVLASISIYLTLRLQEQARTSTMISDLSAAYKAAVAFHLDDAEGEVTDEILEEYGYRPTDGVTITVDDGFESTLRLLADHPGVTDTYQVDRTGKISKP